MDLQTLFACMDFSRARLLGSLDAIAASGEDPARVLAWRPGPGRAHIAWQAMHCAATLDRYLNVMIRAAQPRDEALVAAYAGGTSPSDQGIPSLDAIRDALARTLEDFKAYYTTLTPAELSRQVGPPDRRRTQAEVLLLMAWHEAHHQGQIHLTWNMYKQAHDLAT